MSKSEHDSLTLAQEPADERIVKQLYAHGFINAQGRIFALEWLTPHQRWGHWVSLLCTFIGCTLILAGMIFFFAYNWQKMSSFYKFTVIEAALVCAILGAWIYSLETLSGKLFIASASVLVGIFLAVFGQIYQTGADAYQLFVAWSLLILPWVLISRFAPLWLIWIILVNVSWILYWTQMIAPSAFESFLLMGLMGLNAAFLLLREIFCLKKAVWLQQSWQLPILLTILLIVSFIPIALFILGFYEKRTLMMAAFFGILMQGSLYIYYRYYQFNRPALTLILMSFCLLLLTVMWRFSQNFNSDALQLLFMAISTLVVFTAGAALLKKVSPLMRIPNRF